MRRPQSIHLSHVHVHIATEASVGETPAGGVSPIYIWIAGRLKPALAKRQPRRVKGYLAHKVSVLGEKGVDVRAWRHEMLHHQPHLPREILC